jgi:hypothetical protein
LFAINITYIVDVLPTANGQLKQPWFPTAWRCHGLAQGLKSIFRGARLRTLRRRFLLPPLAL